VRIGSDGLRRREWNGNVQFVEKHLLDPLKWKEPKRIFVNSMSDLFHENVTDEMRDKIFAVMALCPHHTFQVLTKRPARMIDYFSSTWLPGTPNPAAPGRFGLRVREAAIGSQIVNIECQRKLAPLAAWSGIPLPNVHLGVSCENQATADERIPLLLQTPAAVRFISAEPLLGPLDLKRWTRIAWQCSGCREYFAGGLQRTCPSCSKENYWTGSHAFNPRGGQIGTGLNWVIVGGESGPGARPMHPDWARSLRDQCQEAGVPYFFKQWGEWHPAEKCGQGEVTTKDGEVRKTEKYALPAYCGGGGSELQRIDGQPVIRVGKKVSGAMLDGREWHEFPAVPA
jgi:protein gp37